MNRTTPFSLLLVSGLILALLLMACGSPPGDSPPSTSGTSAGPTAGSEATSNSPAEGGIASKYESTWRTDFNVEITQALAAKGITGCGEYKYKASVAEQREYIVYCTADGENWTAYLVWTGINEVMGPYPPDPSLE